MGFFMGSGSRIDAVDKDESVLHPSTSRDVKNVSDGDEHIVP